MTYNKVIYSNSYSIYIEGKLVLQFQYTYDIKEYTINYIISNLLNTIGI